MSLIHCQSLNEATSMLRGQMLQPYRNTGIDLDGLIASRFLGIESSGNAALDPDASWTEIVRSWWGLGATWGLCLDSGAGETAWNLLLPAMPDAASRTVPTLLPGARLEEGGSFSSLSRRVQTLPYRVAMAGHPGVGESARLESLVRALRGRDMMLLILAKSVSGEGIRREINRLEQEEQYLRDEYLSRPGLEKESHSRANRYLELVHAASERADVAQQEGAWQVRVILAASSAGDLNHARSLLQSAYGGDGGKPEPLRWQEMTDPRASTLMRSAELAALSRPPRSELPGFRVEARIARPGVAESDRMQPLFSTTAPSAVGATVAIGRIRDEGGVPRDWLEIPTEALCRHMLVAGMNGSGKSVSCEHIALELWRESKIPWLVVEPGMKNGYRRLLNSEIGEDLKVYSVGVPGVARLPLNPMAAPVGTILADHTSALYSVIASAFELYAPLPEVLATSIEQTYKKHGWDLTGRVPSGRPPLLSDLIREIDVASRSWGWSREVTDNIRSSLLMRLRRLSEGPLAPELSAADGLNMQELLSHPAIIELSAVPDANSQALIMGLIALRLRHHWRLSGPSSKLRHVTFIEEAHRLLGNVAATEANSARIRATEDLANMLAELRAFGAGLVVVDQTPSALVPAVISNTSTKLLHRLDSSDDREQAGRAAGLPAADVDILGALRPGECVVRTDRRPRPFRLSMPNPSLTYGSLPVPELPQVETPPFRPRCSVCGSGGCLAESEASQPGARDARMRQLHAHFQDGTTAVWDWARGELSEQALQNGSDAPLCFLVSFARSANLPESTIREIQNSFRNYRPKHNPNPIQS